MMSISVIIKALNEESNIARAIESALAAVPAGEVILADSGSSDATVEIARRYPVRIVQLRNPAERCCGAGPQLGYQYARGDLICLIDGDMELAPGFLADAEAFLAVNPRAAGVGGTVVDKVLVSVEYQRRNKRGTRDLRPGPVDRLNGGGLYRRDAIVQAGYFSDRNLHGYEEFDLAVRLRERGWTLHRLPRLFVDHYGHVTGGYTLLWRRLRSRYIYGVGEVLRGALGRPHWRQTLADLPEIRLWLLVYCGWIAGIAALLLALWMPLAWMVLAALVVLPVAALTGRYRSIELGLYAFIGWNAHALGMALGFVRPRISPDAWIDSMEFTAPRSGMPSTPSVTTRSGPSFASEAVHDV